MAFGPDEVGHWKDKLPYVRHDLELIREREDILKRFGPFTRGFDFGGPVAAARGPAYRNDAFVLRNTVAPRFDAVDPSTMYSPERGFGWASDGIRNANALTPAPYAEVRATVANPRHLPRNVLFGDSVHGDGPQLFRIRVADGEYTVQLLNPDATGATLTLHADGGILDVPMPEGAWDIAAIVIQGPELSPKTAAASHALPARKPTVLHNPPTSADVGKPLDLTLRLSPATGVATVRLHYRAVDQTAEFMMIEHPASPVVKFTIPAERMPSTCDLMYYFEILPESGSGWFSPDPRVETPYHVVHTTSASSANR